MSLFGISHLPLRTLGLENIPAVPVSTLGTVDALRKLSARATQIEPAKQGLADHSYTIDGEQATGRNFLFGLQAESFGESEEDTLIREIEENHQEDWTEALQDIVSDKPTVSDEPQPEFFRMLPDPRTLLSLDEPEQFAISWTTFNGVYKDAEPSLAGWASTLKDADEATKQFWPTMATYGLAYNLLILQKVGLSQIDAVKTLFDGAWTDELDELYADGRLYGIDMGIFGTVKPHQKDNIDRFTPNTYTLLAQDAQTKAITPIAVRVAGHEGIGKQVFSRSNATPSAWMYALQAAKVSVTVYGIWLGHVYHWHIVTAAMQMTMHNTFDKKHPIYQLLKPSSNYLFGFDNALLALWGKAAPPASINSSNEFLRLCDTFANGRRFFDDDPKATIARLGLNEADFTDQVAWDLYPIIQTYLALWQAVETYVQLFVDTTYPSDQAIVDDNKLQQWIKASSQANKGNIRGLPAMDSRAALQRVLTSQLYRTTAHGLSRLNRTANPALTFVANFPPCLQSRSIPTPDTTLTTKQLLTYLPTTGTIGEMVTFYYTFVFSTPYVPLIPQNGSEAQLPFPNETDPRNHALVHFRETIIAFMKQYQPGSPQINQWPLNIET